MTAGAAGSPLDRSTVGTEVERKFLVDHVPADLEQYPSDTIAQGYLSLDPNGTQVRLRRRGYHTLLTIKSGRGLARAEEEFVIDGPRFERLWPATEGRRIEKTRYKIPLDDGLVLELDVFAGALEGLVLAEVEFDSVDAAHAFRPPEWLRPEVTEDRRYQNSRLALHGAPDREAVGPNGILDGEPLDAGLVNVTLAQLRTASAALLSASPSERAKAIHTSRKAFKRARAFVRVARPGLGDEVARRDNAILRDAGARLSGTRDAEVMVEALDRLVEKSKDLDAGHVAGLRAELVRVRDDAYARARSEQGSIVEVLNQIDAASGEIAGWSLGAAPADELAAGLARILRKGRKALKIADHTDGAERTEALHELRKRAKDLWHAAELLEVADPPQMRALQAQAHTLADHLGDDHDLAVLAERAAAAGPDAFADEHDAQLLADAIVARRAKLERKALKLAKTIHESKHRSLVRAVQHLNAP